MGRKVMDGIFVGGILLALLAGLGRTLFFPRELNAYENRYAERIARPTVSGVLDGSFQDSVEAALSDQVQLSDRFKRTYNTLSAQYLRTLSAPILPRCRDRYVNISGTLLYNGYLVYPAFAMEDVAGPLADRADNINRYAAAHPELDFYLYYLERDIDLNFETGERPGARQYFFDRLDLPSGHMAYLPLDDFNQFSARFLRTDHHWNCAGSYRGYTEMAALLGVDEPLLAPQGEAVEVGTLYGSRSTGKTCLFSEPFYAYRFDYPEMDVSINGQSAADYGRQEEFLSGGGGQLSYGAFYGWDDAEVRFSTHRPGRDNLLILGESYDNAVVKLLASHFNDTYAVDLRNYKAQTGEDFRFSDYVASRGITKVLFTGCMTLYRTDEFALEG